MAQDDGAPTATLDDRPDQSPEAQVERPADAELIHNRLREKEHLVAALTERLEQAAEQLDRLRRTGVDKGRRALGGGLPAEVVEDHKQTLDDLKRVISSWEDMQAGATLGRIETQIAELRDLFVGSGQAVAYHPAPGAAHPTAPPAAPHAAPPREKSAEVPAGRAGGNAWWEAQKAALLGQPAAGDAQPAVDAGPGTPAAQNGGDAPAAGSGDLAALNIPDLPAPLDFDSMTLDDARQAIRERDIVIQQLREPLLLLRASGQLPAEMQSLASLPEPLRARIAELEMQWQAKFRQVELDVSLERARLAREQSAVRQQQEALQKQFRKGGGPARTTPDDDGSKSDDSSSKRRWFRFMGKNGDEPSETDPAEPGQ